jgi:hypothetical protein
MEAGTPSSFYLSAAVLAYADTFMGNSGYLHKSASAQLMMAL